MPTRARIPAAALLTFLVFLLPPAFGEGKAPPALVLIPGGTYRQGDDASGYQDETPSRTVTISAFLLAACETTFTEFDRFCDDTQRTKPGEHGWGRGERPVINVSWLDAAEYCNWLSGQEGLAPFYRIAGSAVSMDWAAGGYRLPTEAEWEYAARAGSADATAGAFDAQAWSTRNSGRTTHPVGKKDPDALGLYDLRGNVWEWCNDWFAPYSAGEARDPRGPDAGQLRVQRGGSWYDTFGERPTTRSRQPPTMQLPTLGFRVARSASGR